MAKTSIKALGIKEIKPEIFEVPFGDKTYTVKEFLTTNEKLTVIAKIMSTVSVYASEMSFFNQVQWRVITWLFLVDAYTNINLTEKQWDEPSKTYDLLLRNNIFKQIKELATDIDEVIDDAEIMAEEIYKYRNSALGILDSIQSDYNDKKMNVDDLMEKVNNPENLSFLKEIMEKLG